MAPMLTITQKAILSILNESTEPLPLSAIGKRLDVTYQTVSNHISVLMTQGRVQLVGRKGNANLYHLGEINDSLPRVQWVDKSITIRDKTEEIVKSGKMPTDPHAKALIDLFGKFYRLCYQAMRDDNPAMISSGQLKDLQASIYKRHQLIKALERMYRDVLNNNELWDPKDLPKSLFVKDPTMTNELALDLSVRIQEMLTGKTVTNAGDIGNEQ